MEVNIRHHTLWQSRTTRVGNLEADIVGGIFQPFYDPLALSYRAGVLIIMHNKEKDFGRH